MHSPFQSAPQVCHIATEDAVARVAEGSLMLIDVRDPVERQMSGVAKGAIAIPLAAFQMQADPRSPEHHEALSIDRPVALYCASGARSQMAAEAMVQMGYKEVYNIGGLQHWMAAGGEVD